MRCKHCGEVIPILAPPEIIVFCNEGCMNNWLCEQTPPTREDTLDAIEFQNRYEEVI